MAIQITPYPYKVRCEINRCCNRADYAVGEENGAISTKHLYCQAHLKELSETTYKLFEMVPPQEPEPMKAEAIDYLQTIHDLKEELEGKDAFIELLQSRVEELKGEEPKKRRTRAKE